VQGNQRVWRLAFDRAFPGELHGAGTVRPRRARSR
jgi:hypothetical protein